MSKTINYQPTVISIRTLQKHFNKFVEECDEIRNRYVNHLDYEEKRIGDYDEQTTNMLNGGCDDESLNELIDYSIDDGRRLGYLDILKIYNNMLDNIYESVEDIKSL